MLPEVRATGYEFDKALGTIRVAAQAAERPTLSGDRDAQILLDAAGHLVGIDIAPDRPDRLVVMLGPHEKVSRAEPTVVSVEAGGKAVNLRRPGFDRVTAGANPYVVV